MNPAKLDGELLKETAAESTAILIKNPLLKNSREDLLYY